MPRWLVNSCFSLILHFYLSSLRSATVCPVPHGIYHSFEELQSISSTNGATRPASRRCGQRRREREVNL